MISNSVIKVYLKRSKRNRRIICIDFGTLRYEHASFANIQSKSMYLSVRYANSLNILQSFDFVIVDILNTFAEADMFAGHNAVKPFLQSNCFTPQCGKNLFYSGFSFHHYFQITICQKLFSVMR